MARYVNPILQLVNNDASGVAAGWTLTFYSTGTTTLKDTFSDAGLTIANTNPVVADSAGRFGNIFLEAGTYRVILKDDADVTIWDADPVEGSIGNSGAVDEIDNNYVVTLGDATKLLAVDATNGPITITLLPAATGGDGFTIAVKKVDSSANAVTIDGDGSEEIDGDAAVILTEQWQGVSLRSDAAGWQREALTLKPPASRLVGTDASGNFDSISVSGPDLTFTGSAITGNFHRGHFVGFGLANNSVDAAHDIDIAAGECRSALNDADIMLAAITKRIDAVWASGTGNGGLATSLTAPANDTWYHVFAILVGGVADAGFDTSSAAANLIADNSATAYYRLGSVLTDGSANIIAFSQAGDEFLWLDPPLSVETTNPGTSAVTATVAVPTGLVMWALINIGLVGGTATSPALYISPLVANDEAPSRTAAPLGQNIVTGGAVTGELVGMPPVRTNTSAQIRYRLTASVGDTALRISTLGWIDRRGRDG